MEPVKLVFDNSMVLLTIGDYLRMIEVIQALDEKKLILNTSYNSDVPDWEVVNESEVIDRLNGEIYELVAKLRVASSENFKLKRGFKGWVRRLFVKKEYWYNQ